MIAKTERNKQADVVLAFWELAGEARWFTRNDAFDANVRQHFSEQHFAAARGEYADWMTRAEDALALLLLLCRLTLLLLVTIALTGYNQLFLAVCICDKSAVADVFGVGVRPVCATFLAFVVTVRAVGV